MTLRVELEEVPFAILEAVKARILKNRRDLAQQQQQQFRRSVRPRPQARKFGAERNRWARPRPAVILSDGYQVALGYAAVIPQQNSSANNNYRIYSGDESQHVDVAFPIASEPQIDLRYTYLPGYEYLETHGYYYSGDDIWETSWVNGYLEDRLIIALPLDSSTFVLYLGYASYWRKRYIGYHVKAIRDAYSTIIGADLLDHFSETKNSWQVSHKCFLVGKSAVREISTVPDALKLSAQNLNGLLKQEIGYQEPEFAPVAGIPLLSFFYLSGVASSYLQDWNNFTFAGSWRPAVDYALGQQYGLGRLTDNPHGSVRDFDSQCFSPAVFSLLQQSAAVRVATDQGAFNSYPTVRMWFVDDSSFPGAFINTGSEANGNDFYRYFRFTNTYPDSRTVAMPASVLQDNTFPEVRAAGLGLTILAWDWDKPAFCRQQLLTLGFSDADLTP